jgi:hypothetical protein
MTRRITFFALVMTVAAAGASRQAHVPTGPDGFVAHEWGTFTSVAGEDGRAVQWLPQSGPTDLPDFVGRIDCRLKSGLAGTVRMETPVIYFYAPREMQVSVGVQFRQGVITEWFPRPVAPSEATINAALRGQIAWTNVQVIPNAQQAFRVESTPNHYYVARNTDAAPLQVGAEQERFLFYRGVGRVPPPIDASVTGDGQLAVSHSRGEALGDVMLFENRDGAMAYRSASISAARVVFNPLEPEGESGTPHLQLQKLLVAHGLYEKEARAMIESWRGSWFEQGTRLFYIVSNEAVDAILPLQISPRPTQLSRVFVGRLEIVTPSTLREVRTALQKNDRAKLAQYGRFLEPIGERLLSTLPEMERPSMKKRLQLAQTSLRLTFPCR